MTDTSKREELIERPWTSDTERIARSIAQSSTWSFGQAMALVLAVDALSPAESVAVLSEPQAEPTDAQVKAEADRRWPHTGNGGDLDHSRAVRRLSFRQGAEWMRAAAAVREGGQGHGA